jgi:hypothetical protein
MKIGRHTSCGPLQLANYSLRLGGVCTDHKNGPCQKFSIWKEKPLASQEGNLGKNISLLDLITNPRAGQVAAQEKP